MKLLKQFLHCFPSHKRNILQSFQTRWKALKEENAGAQLHITVKR